MKVKFLKGNGVFETGEVIWVEAAEAEKLIADGFVEEVKAETEPVKVKKPK